MWPNGQYVLAGDIIFLLDEHFVISLFCLFGISQVGLMPPTCPAIHAVYGMPRMANRCVHLRIFKYAPSPGPPGSVFGHPFRTWEPRWGM